MSRDSRREARAASDAGSSAGRAERRAYLDDLMTRVRELRESSAFEPPSHTEERVDLAQVKADLRASRRHNTLVVVTMLVVMLVVMAASLFIPFFSMSEAQAWFYDPAAVLDCWATWATTTIGPLFDSALANRSDMLWAAYQERHPEVIITYVLNRGTVTVLVVLCGCMLAASGLLFQTAFRNPLATPSMLGVADGVTLGCTIFAMMGFSSISESSQTYLALVYGCGAVMLVVVFALSRVIAGGRRYSVFDLLLVGTVITQLVSGVNNHIANFIMDSDTWERFYEVTQAYDAIIQPLTQQIVVVAAVLTVIPALVLSFRMNLLAFDDGEARLLGVRPGVLRAVALVLGSLMQLAAIASIGQVAMLSLAVPFLVRYLLPSDFRYQLVGNFLLGSIVLLVCMAVQPFIHITYVSMPVGTVVGVLVVPLFLWIVALQRRGWE